MNAYVKPEAFSYHTPQQRAAQIMAAVNGAPPVLTAEKVAEFHQLLGNIFLVASECAAIGNEFLEGNGSEELTERMLLGLGNIKSNLIFIGAVINGKK